MPRFLQRVRKIAGLARRAVQVLRSDGPGAVCFRTYRYLALRSGILVQQDHVVALLQGQSGLAQAFARQQQSFGALTLQLAELQEQRTQSLRWLAIHHPSARDNTTVAPLADADAGPRVSIIMPVWNRQALVGAAMDSVLNQTCRNWELLVVDDGSTDGSREVILERTHDPRVRLLTQDHQGVCRARNRALREARGEIITYLDSDNEWFPGYLTEVVRTFGKWPDADCAYAAQLVEGGNHGEAWIRSVRFQRESFSDAGVIDLNVFAHRRELVDRYGDFDERLTRLVDWDLIIRYTRHRDPVPVPVIGGRYRVAGDDSISSTADFGRNFYALRRKHIRPLPRDLRVLYVVWDYPQLTETYVRWEIACMKRWGVHVEVWSEVERTACP
jgi:glycosyltransferase involved in cell wall biosynthesis